ncbi:MAG: lysylphosphatidylglycerol synthase transmembrane domain-containing protein [Acidimicrobiales bacterium]
MDERGAEPDDDLLTGPGWQRHPLDIFRLAVAAVVLAACWTVAVQDPGQVRASTANLARLLDAQPRWAGDVLLGVTQVLAVVGPIALLAVLVRRRRLLATALGAALVAAALVAAFAGRLEDLVPSRLLVAERQPSWVIGAAFPSAPYVAAVVAALVVVGPVLSQGWRRAGLGMVLFGLACRVLSGVAVPLSLALTASAGLLVGSAALAALGSPRRAASRRAVLEGLRTAGLAAVDIEPYPVGAQHEQTFLATTATGHRSFVKLLGREERSDDVLYRALRFLRVKDLDDELPSWQPLQMVEREAFAQLLAARAGATVPELHAVGATEGGDGLLAAEVLDATPLDLCPLDDLGDDVLDAAWRELVALRRQGIAHRALTARHLLLTTVDPLGIDGGDAADAGPGAPRVTVTDFRWSVQQATPPQLGADVASLVVSLATVVGAERSVEAAARVLEPGDIAAALPFVQPLALPGDVQDAIHGNKAILPLVRAQLQEAAGGVPYELAHIERIGPRQVASLVAGVFVVYSLLGLASNREDIAHALSSASLVHLPGLLVLASLPFFAGAAALLAVVPRRLPYDESVEVMLGQSFLNRFTPANAGGMALRIRYLQKRGVDMGGAAAGVGLTSVASGICQVIVLVAFAAWAGSRTGSTFSLPEASTVAVVVAVVAVASGLVWFTPFGRRVVARRVKTTGRQVATTLRDLGAQPSRFVTLFAATMVGKVALVAAFIVTCTALHLHVAVAQLGLLYLTASSVAAAAPTPGGVGAVEAALTAALTGVGVAPADALAAAFLFRIVTFWLPVPFGWWALHRLQGAVLG